MKLFVFDELFHVATVQHGFVYHSGEGFWHSIIRKQQCSWLIPQPGKTANGRRRRGRMCKNEAYYATYTGAEEEIHQWVDPLCTVHHRKRMTTEKQE